jgi:hypothetical protein
MVIPTGGVGGKQNSDNGNNDKGGNDNVSGGHHQRWHKERY